MVSVAFPTILSVLLVILLGFILSRTLLENEAFGLALVDYVTGFYFPYYYLISSQKPASLAALFYPLS